MSRIVGTCSRAKNNDQQHARQHHGAGEGEKGTVDRVPRGIDIEFEQPQPWLKSRDGTFELRCHAATGAAPTAIQQHGNAARADVALEFRPLTSTRSPRSDGAGARGGLLFGLVGWQVALVYLVFGLVNRSPPLSPTAKETAGEEKESATAPRLTVRLLLGTPWAPVIFILCSRHPFLDDSRGAASPPILLLFGKHFPALWVAFSSGNLPHPFGHEVDRLA